MRIAYFSPLNPAPTGISDYSEELLPPLATRAEVEVFIGDYEATNGALKATLPIHHYSRFDEIDFHHRFDALVYHMGNSTQHDYIYAQLTKRPGVLVLHEVVLHHFLYEVLLNRGHREAYLREIAYSHGTEGVMAARSHLRGHRPIEPFRYPAFHRAVDASLGVIVHSRHAEAAIQDARPNALTVKVPALMSVTELPNGYVVRAKLGILPRQFVIGSFGHMAPHKRIDVALAAFAQFRRSHPDAIYLLVGETDPTAQIDKIVDDLGLRKAVVRTGRLPDLTSFKAYAVACDACVNLRYPSAGETSASALRLLSLGRPTLVSDVDAFSELPDDCCVKVPIGPNEVSDVFSHFERLASDPGLRYALGARAREMVWRDHSPERVAELYLEAIQSIYSRRLELHGMWLVNEVSQTMTDLDMWPAELGRHQMQGAFERNLVAVLGELGL